MISSAFSIVESLWAMTMAVRPFISAVIASCTLFSVDVSTLLVASSSIKTGELDKKALAIVRSCFCPFDIFPPSSLISVSYPLSRVEIK